MPRRKRQTSLLAFPTLRPRTGRNQGVSRLRKPRDRPVVSPEGNEPPDEASIRVGLDETGEIGRHAPSKQRSVRRRTGRRGSPGMDQQARGPPRGDGDLGQSWGPSVFSRSQSSIASWTDSLMLPFPMPFTSAIARRKRSARSRGRTTLIRSFGWFELAATSRHKRTCLYAHVRKVKVVCAYTHSRGRIRWRTRRTS